MAEATTVPVSGGLLPERFSEHIRAQLDGLRRKDAAFAAQVEALRARYGSGARLAREVELVRDADEAFARRVASVDWEELAAEKRSELRDSLSRLTLDGDEAAFF